MTLEDLKPRLLSGGVTLAFDTSALWADRKRIELCQAVARLNERLRQQGKKALRLVVSTVAHVEKSFDLKQRFRADFDNARILAGLRDAGLEIEPFDNRHALHTAVVLGARYDSPEEWRAAKKNRYLQALGLALDTPSNAGKKCAATVDWLIAGHAQAEAALLIVEDTGVEWAGLDRVNVQMLSTALEQLVSEAA